MSSLLTPYKERSPLTSFNFIDTTDNQFFDKFLTKKLQDENVF